MYSNKINFQFVYILEAHAQDEWPICSSRWCPSRNPVKYNQTKTKEDRIAVAKDFIKEFNLTIPLILDNMDNSFEKTYSSWPVRIFIIQNGILTYKAQPSEKMLELEDLITLLGKI